MPDQMPAAMPTERSELAYEDARDQLVEVVRTLEQGGTTLAESLALWERGEDLARICQSALGGARARLDEVLGSDHDPAESPDGP